MELSRSYKARLPDQLKLKKLGESQPNLVIPQESAQFIPAHLKKIGIDYDYPVVGKGFIKLLYRDFIVEEISKEHDVVSTILPLDNDREPEPLTIESPKIGATLVKRGTDTFEALEQLSEQLQIPLSHIGYAGLKDSRAITSQEISIKEPLDLEVLKNVTLPNIFLKNMRLQNHVLRPGHLKGNRFTILVRSKDIDTPTLQKKIEEVLTNKPLNFYSLQRFGPRLLSHTIGHLILQTKYHEAVKMLLLGESPQEFLVFQQKRKEAAAHWGNWKKISQIFSAFPYFFYFELKVLESLQKDSFHFVNALNSIPEQTQFMVYAYMSYCFNKLLSYQQSIGVIPDELPLLRNTSESLDFYQKVMTSDQISQILFYHKVFPFINLSRPQMVKTKIDVKIHRIVEINEGYIFHFDLQKGSYATTFLSQIFHLYQGGIAPEWISQEEVDTRLFIDLPSLEGTEQQFFDTSNNIESKLGIDF